MILLTSSLAMKLIMEGEETGLQDHWYLVDTHGQKFRLPKTMLFLGREECDVVVASQSVDKRHAVLTFDLYLNRFKVKDLSTTNGTFVNNSRIPEQEYVTLNHMDSVRLGHDAMMYHIEQGSQITNQGGQLPDPHFVPSWATRHPQDSTTIHVHTHAMAECQGCIAEQNIEHTCSLRPDSKPDVDDDDLRIEDSDLNSPHQHKHHQQQHHHHDHHHSQQQSHHHQQHEHQVDHHHQQQQPHHPKMAQRHSQDQQQEGDEHHPRRPHRHSDHYLPPHSHQPHVEETNHASHQQEISQGDQTHDSEEAATPEENSGGSSGLGRNTWPRKRHQRQMAHVSSIFNADAPDSSDLTASEARPAGAAPAMYFVSFDDSVCNASSKSSGSEVKRIPRNSRNPLPPELATVKKGTPLYGQPSWWGDPDEEGEEDHSASSSSKHDGDKKSANKKTRPSNLGLSGEESAGSSTSAGTKKGVAMDGERVKPHQGATYMEIPLKDDDSPEGDDDTKDTLTPAKSVSSSLSKDSLSVSPENKQSHANKSAKMSSPSAEVNPATSFTIDLDDPEHPPKKSLNIGSSLSEFVPSKIRKNFRERKDKGISSKTGSKESTPSKNSEERELSPLHQRRIDEIWSQVVEGKGKSRLTSVQATAGSSLRSPNLEEIDRLSELSEERRSLDREVDKKAAIKKPVASKSPQITRSSKAKSSSSTTLASSAKSPSAVGITAAHSMASVNVSQYSDPTSYLIDKMFEGGTTSAPSLNEKELSPEQKMYREAASHDKTASARRSTEKSVVRPIINATVSHGANVTASKNGLKDASSKTAKKPVVQDEDEDDLRITEDIPDDDDDEDVGGEEEINDKEDKASEAGTYTIEADEEGEEEEEARKKIDKVFGVDVEDFTSEHPQIDPLRLASPGGYDNVYDDLDDTDGDKTPLDENGHSPFGDDIDDLALEDDYDGNSDMAATDGVQPWVHQLTALTNQKASKSTDSPRTPDDADASLSKKPPQGISRKRPGTGRKLPSIPGIDKSPVDSEHSSYYGDQDLTIGDDAPSGKSPDFPVNGKNNMTSNGRPARISSQTRSKTMNNGYSDSVSQDGASAASPRSSRSRGSVDTELLLQDTETVMAAMEARMAYKGNRDRKNTYNVDLDTDAFSARSLVNGDDDYVKPTLYNSPRDALAKRQQRESLTTKSTNNNASATPPTTTGKKPVGRSYSQTIASKSKSTASPRGTPSAPSGAKRSVVSDVFSSRRDSVDNDSIISDVSSETGDGNLSRSSSKGKGTITMSKTNRAFALRRARADSFDEPTTPRSAKSAASSKSSGSSVRSTSLHSNTRVRSAADTNRSEATSLGAQIVRKSQTNNAQDRARRSSGASVSRTDSGRNSLRLQRASSLTIAQSASGSISSKRETTPKSHLRSTPTGKGSSTLSISGVSSGSFSSRSQSQPGSRSNSPKAAERAAWKRRKDYDPRKAVAEAKAKAKEGGPSVTMRPKPSASSNIKRRMIRSASFTNSGGLSTVGVNSSVSSSQDFMDRRDHYESEDLRRAFIPFHNSLRTVDRSTHSADEDDSLVSANSTQASYDSLIVSSIYQISLKLKTFTDKSLNKLREQNRVSHTPSPVDDFLSDSGKSEITAWKSANQELAGILKNLRKLERHVQMMNSVLFPEDEVNSEVSSALPVGHQEKQRYYQEMKRIRSEIAGFQPIDHPRPDESDIASPEMAEFSQFT